MANSFNRNFVPENNQAQEKDVLRIGADGGVPIKIKKDGTIEAKGFVDTTDNLEFFTKGTSIFAKYKVNRDTSLTLNLNTNTLSYNSLKSYFLKLKNAFLSYAYPKGSYSHIQKAKSNFLGRSIKRIASNILTSGSIFIYHFIRNNKVYAEKTSHRMQTKIFKVPVQLKFANSFQSLNDLVVIKTGQFNYAGAVRSGFVAGAEKIVYVSPHEEFSGTAYYKTTGSFRHLGTGDLYSTFSGASGSGEALARSNYYYLSSKDYFFPSGYTLSGGASYQKLDGNGDLVTVAASGSIKDTNFYSLYTGLTGSSIYTGKWDGIIPAYTPFYIETWSTNATSIGYEGTIEVTPASGFQNLDIEIVGFGIASSNNQSSAESTAERKAHGSALRKLESTLIKMDVTESGRSLRQYVKHVENQTNF